MNKSELITAVAERTGLEAKKQVDVAINTALDIITEKLVSGEKVQLLGFGTFEVKERKARKARNPRTNEVVPIPACKAPAFKVGKALKDKFD